ncbi:MAG: phosphohydrolase [Bacteroidales bacterium]|nr:phosphohydrolase [Bacteroidales bacterium]
MPDGAPRDAYEWWRYDEVPEDLKAYVEHEILPRHEHYDAAHRPDHIRRVIARSMAMQPSAITYTAAAMHDLGLCEGRESHHLASGRIIRAGIGMVDGKAVDQPLRRWFNEAEIETIAQAAEDHRASAKTPPRSLLGCIIAEADRDIEPETIVRRTMEYGLSHYPELNKEGHWQRTLDHLHEKYAEGGYIKLWLPDSPNATPLAELRELIRDEKKLKTLFDNLWTSF